MIKILTLLQWYYSREIYFKSFWMLVSQIACHSFKKTTIINSSYLLFGVEITF